MTWSEIEVQVLIVCFHLFSNSADTSVQVELGLARRVFDLIYEATNQLKNIERRQPSMRCKKSLITLI